MAGGIWMTSVAAHHTQVAVTGEADTPGRRAADGSVLLCTAPGPPSGLGSAMLISLVTWLLASAMLSLAVVSQAARFASRPTPVLRLSRS
jgi:hypothetical protein